MGQIDKSTRFGDYVFKSLRARTAVDMFQCHSITSSSAQYFMNNMDFIGKRTLYHKTNCAKSKGVEDTGSTW